MRALLLGLLVGVVLAGAAGAGAVSMRLFTVHNGDHVITSQQALGCAVTSGPTITCGEVSRPHGYFIAINAIGLAVTLNNRVVFARRCC